MVKPTRKGKNMRIEKSNNGVTLIREPGDKAISKESTVTHHLRRLLGRPEWKRCYPNKIGLTGCEQGVQSKTAIYWHERYAIEQAHKAFNAGSVFYLKSV